LGGRKARTEEQVHQLFDHVDNSSGNSGDSYEEGRNKRRTYKTKPRRYAAIVIAPSAWACGSRVERLTSTSLDGGWWWGCSRSLVTRLGPDSLRPHQPLGVYGATGNGQWALSTGHDWAHQTPNDGDQGRQLG
jgi:hypothetical protein